VEPLTCIPITKELRTKYEKHFEPYPGTTHMIIAGEHRWKASNLLDMQQEVPVYVIDGLEEDLQRFLTVKMNILKGKLNPMKLIKLVKWLEKKYEKDVMKAMMGFTEEAVFEQIFADVRKSLPDEMKEELDKQGEEIKTIDGLANVLNDLFTKYGATVKWNFMFFSYGGKDHVMIRCDKPLWEDVTAMLKLCDQKNTDSNSVLKKLMSGWNGRSDLFKEKTAE